MLILSLFNFRRVVPHKRSLGQYWFLSQTTSVRFSRKMFGS